MILCLATLILCKIEFRKMPVCSEGKGNKSGWFLFWIFKERTRRKIHTAINTESLQNKNIGLVRIIKVVLIVPSQYINCDSTIGVFVTSLVYDRNN